MDNVSSIYGDVTKAASITSMVSNIKLPGSDLVSSQIDALKAKANLDSALPDMSSMVESIKSGAIFASKAPDLSALTGLGIDTSAITSTLSAQQGNLLQDISLSQKLLESKAKLAAMAGTVLSPEEIKASLGPVGAMDAAKEQIAALSAKAAELQLLKDNPNTDPVELATKLAAMNTDVTSKMTEVTASTDAVRADAEKQLGANKLVEVLAKPMSPDIKAVLEKNMDLSQINKYVVNKTQSVKIPENIKPEDAINPPAIKIPNKDAIEQTSPPPLPAIQSKDTHVWIREIEYMDSLLKAADDAYFNYMGVNNRKDTAAANADALIRKIKLSGEMTAQELDILDKRTAIVRSKPNEADRTVEEKQIIEEYLTNVRPLMLNTKEYLKIDQMQKDISNAYKDRNAVYNCWKEEKSRFTLPKDLELKIRNS